MLKWGQTCYVRVLNSASPQWLVFINLWAEMLAADGGRGFPARLASDCSFVFFHFRWCELSNSWDLQETPKWFPAGGETAGMNIRIYQPEAIVLSWNTNSQKNVFFEAWLDSPSGLLPPESCPLPRCNKTCQNMDGNLQGEISSALRKQWALFYMWQSMTVPRWTNPYIEVVMV